jgi:hypothetical protein
MSIFANPNEPLAIGLAVTYDELIISLADGCKLPVPIAWYPPFVGSRQASSPFFKKVK